MKLRHVLKAQILIFLTYCSVAFAKSDVVCSVSDLNIVFDAGNCTNGNIDFSFTFTGTDFGSSGFTLITPHGNFSYNLGDPYTGTILQSCDFYELWTIQDNLNPSCSTSSEIGPICCACDFTAAIYESFCDVDQFFLSFLYLESGNQCENTSFYLVYNGDNYPMEIYESEDFFLGSIGYTEEEFIEFQFCAGNSSYTQCQTFNITNPCFGNIWEINILDSEPTCDGGNAIISYEILGFYSENKPVTITTNMGTTDIITSPGIHTLSLPALCNGPVMLRASNYNNTITLTQTLSSLCCPCSTEFTFQPQPCIDGHFDLVFDQSAVSGSCQNYQWNATINNSTYQLQDLELEDYYFLSGLTAHDSILTIDLCSPVPFDPYCITQTIQNPCYNMVADTCSLLAFQIDLDSAVCFQDSMRLPFTYHSTDTTDFMYIIRSSLGTTDTIIVGTTEYITVPSPCDTMVIFTIYDPNFIDCVVHDTIQALCCPCGFDLSATATCNGDMTMISVMLDSIWGNCVADTLTVLIGGNTYNWIGTQDFSTNYAVGNSQDSIDISVCHDGFYTFCVHTTIANPCFVPPACQVGNLAIDAISDCLTNGTYKQVSLSFSSQNFGQNGFIVNTDSGLDSTFQFNGNQCTVVLPALCISDNIYITDVNDHTCTTSMALPELCCPCQTNITMTSNGCNDGNVYPIISISDQGTCGLYDWTATVNGNSTNLTLVGDHYEVDPVNSVDSLLVFIVCSTHPTQTYCDTIPFVNPCFTTTVPCSIGDVSFVIDTAQCIGDSLPVTISFQSQNFGSEGFSITEANGQHWSFTNPNDPITIALSADCTTNYVLHIRDVQDPACGNALTLPALCCPCALSFTPQLQPCNDAGFEALIAFDGLDGSCAAGDWTVSINGTQVDYTATSAGLMIDDEILLVDTILTFEVCSQLSIGSFCNQVTIDNPCPIIIGTDDTALDDLISLQTTNDEIIVVNKSNSDLTFELFDITGRKLIASKKISLNADFRVSTTSYLNGVYIISIQQDDAVFLKSFVIIK